MTSSGKRLRPSRIRRRNAMVGIGLVLAFGTQIYLTILSPMINPKPYQDIREQARLRALQVKGPE